VSTGIRFSDRQVPRILSGQKTVTRIKVPSPWEPGTEITAFRIVNEVEQPFAILKVVDAHEHLLSDMTDAEAVKEGYSDLEEFLRAWDAIHGYTNETETIWAIRFELLRKIDDRDIAAIM
jgi:hypothetical protein